MGQHAMHTRSRHAITLLLALASVGVQATGNTTAPLPAGCENFTWQVGAELALLSGEPTLIQADASATNIGTMLQLGTFYRARLQPQSAVTLATRPGKPMLDDGAHAGLLGFRVPADGRYRIAISSGHWIDVVDAGSIIESLDFQGRRGCPLVHKIVEFALPAGRDLLLQLAGGTDAEVGVLIHAIAADP